MRPIIIFLALAGVGIIAWLIIARPGKKEEASKLQAISVSKYSDSFNRDVSGLLNVYFLMGEDFVKWDSVSAIEKAIDLEVRLNNLKLDELKKDSSIYLTAQTFIDNAKFNVQSISTEKGIRQQREAFHNLTDNIHQFLNTVKYDSEKLFLQECPMAFDDTESAQWISKSGEDKERRNPYLGVKDPKYGSGMLKCGETIKTINHTGKK